MQQFHGSQKPKRFDSDRANEIVKAARKLQYPHDFATAHRPATNGAAEAAVRRVKEGTTCALFQANLPTSWWAEAMTCFCCLRNISDSLEDGMSPYQKRFHKDFVGNILPFGCAVACLSKAPREKEEIHKFGENT